EVALDAGAGAAYLVDDAEAIEPAWLEGVHTVGLSSGASVPEDLVAGVLERLAGSGFDQVEEVEAVEGRMGFALPPALRLRIGPGPGQLRGSQATRRRVLCARIAWPAGERAGRPRAVPQPLPQVPHALGQAA